MKILLSAAACSPYQGSEPGVGWTVARGYAERGHSVVAMVYNLFRADLEKAESEGLVPENLRFEYINVDEMPTGSAFKLKFWTWHIYKQYASQVRATAQKLIASQNFDFIQHVTIATWRTPIHLSGLGVPFVFGPLGGGENAPLRLLRQLSLKAIIFELIRKIDNVFKFINPTLRISLSQADILISGNSDTYKYLSRMSNNTKICNAYVVSLRSEHINKFYFLRNDTNIDLRLKAFYGGLVEGRKGIAYAIQAVAEAKKLNTLIEYHIYARGSEIQYLKQLAIKLDVCDLVIFHNEPLTGNEYISRIKEYDIFLMPSLRDNCSITLLESMLSGCVPIVADSGGPAEIVNRAEAGYVCTIKSEKLLVEEICRSLVELNINRFKLHSFSNKASKYVKSSFDTNAYISTILEFVEDYNKLNNFR